MLEMLKEEVQQLHLELPRNSLVSWTTGNVSARDRQTGLVVIKPSGVRYEHLRPEQMLVVDLDGKVLEGGLKPSSDTLTHLYIYRHRPEVNGVVHTHSPYVCAFAAVGKSIPVVLTAMCDEFGGAIPLGDLKLIGNEEIGQEVVRMIGSCPAIIMRNHGAFTVGPTAEAAVKAAVMLEDVARGAWLAMQIGEPVLIPDEIVERLHRRYVTAYGQG